jgi:hypothetical protein
MEGGEIRQLEPLVEDQGRLDAAIGQEEAAIQLGQSTSVASHAGLPCVPQPAE